MKVNGKDEAPISRRSDNLRDMKADKDFPRKTLEGDGWTPGSQSRDDPRAKKRTR
jgi:hypothetical protein